MAETLPLLQQIHDQFDVYARYPYADHSMITKVDIQSGPNGYRLTTYPGGAGYGFDGLALDVEVPDGIFSQADPVRVEASRDHGKDLMVLNVESSSENEDGPMSITGTVGSFPAREGLVLPGDKGFDLFTDLHSRLRAFKEPLQDALKVAGINMVPTALGYNESTGFWSYDHERKIATHRRSSVYEVSSEHASAKVVLDGTVEFNGPVKTDSKSMADQLMVYRSGAAEALNQPTNISMEGLLAFSGLHSQLRKLYA